MEAANNIINWFEISVSDIARAKAFYQGIFEIPEMPEMNTHMAFFPSEQGNGKVSGALAKSQYHVPGPSGSVVYMNCNPDLAPIVARVEACGGKVAMPKTSIGPNGFMAMLIDTEGNMVGLHSMS